MNIFWYSEKQSKTSNGNAILIGDKEIKYTEWISSGRKSNFEDAVVVFECDFIPEIKVGDKRSMALDPVSGIIECMKQMGVADTSSLNLSPVAEWAVNEALKQEVDLQATEIETKINILDWQCEINKLKAEIDIAIGSGDKELFLELCRKCNYLNDEL